MIFKRRFQGRKLMKIRNFKLSIIFITFLIVGFSILPLFAFFIPKQEEVYINTKQIRSAQDPNAFISVWNTTKISRDSSSSNQVCLPLDSIGNYNFTADWGDGKNNTITIWNQAEVTHIYDLEGMYSITIIGIILMDGDLTTGEIG